MNGSDQDSDSLYVTNQKDIVEHARRCYLEYPTIVNNIAKDSNVYNNTMDDYANLDNKLSASQLSIGESSNLAQIAQTYDSTFHDKKYADYVCILSVIAQISIDSAKRLFDIDVNKEVKRIKADMNISEYKYPEFWLSIRAEFNKNNINRTLKCPMNYLYNIKINQFKPKESTLPMSYYFVKHTSKKDKRKNKKVEELISTYSIKLLESNNYINDKNAQDKYDKNLLLKLDFENMVNEIRNMYISSSYEDLFSWLIDRCFLITPSISGNKNKIKSTIMTNRSLLLKTLYEVNPKAFLNCFK